MVWGFRNRNNKLVPMQQAMGRIINRSLSIQELCPELLESGEKRCESRAKRNCPVVIFSSSADCENRGMLPGFTHDLSMNGISVLSIERIPPGDTVIAIGEPDNRVLLAADCIASTPREFGCYFSTFRLRELLKPADHPSIMDSIRLLEENSRAELVGT